MHIYGIAIQDCLSRFFFTKKSNLFLDTGNGNSAIIHWPFVTLKVEENNWI